MGPISESRLFLLDMLSVFPLTPHASRPVFMTLHQLLSQPIECFGRVSATGWQSASELATRRVHPRTSNEVLRSGSPVYFRFLLEFKKCVSIQQFHHLHYLEQQHDPRLLL